MNQIKNDFQKLHHRATRGEVLTTEEQHALENWYIEQDQTEQKLLDVTPSALSLTELQTQTDAALKRLELTAQHIQETRALNDSIRQDIALLEKQLAQRRVA
jgi:hypothetical protein